MFPRILLSICLLSSAALAEPAGDVWQPDNGDGTYRNPILYADYSDPDAIRVGDDYWLTASSFNHVPGLPILHSRDLVNWTLVNHALPELPPREHYSVARHDDGVWAPSIGHHEGKFYIFWGDPDFGIYRVTAVDPAGPWTAPVLVKEGKGLIDPCPFWDDDGTAYLVHAWARSRAGINNILTLHRMTPDGSKVLDEGKVIIDGNQMPGWKTIEGPKLYKRDGWYWVFAPAGGVEEGYQAVFRAKNIRGPYEERIALHQGSTGINGPHQGAWVDTPGGGNWFLHFQKTPFHGRVVHLQPMQWREDNWPVIGADPDNDGTGEPVANHRKPDLPEQALRAPATSDEFDRDRLGLQWQWTGNPRDGWWSLTESPGRLRLKCNPTPDADSLWRAPQLLLQKVAAPAITVTTLVSPDLERDGDTAGLVAFGRRYAWIGLRRAEGRVHVVLAVCEDAHDGNLESIVAAADAPPKAVFLRLTMNENGRCRFFWSKDGETFLPTGNETAAEPVHWSGMKVGLFATANGNEKSAGYADFEWFRVDAESGAPSPLDTPNAR